MNQPWNNVIHLKVVITTIELSTQTERSGKYWSMPLLRTKSDTGHCRILEYVTKKTWSTGCWEIATRR